MLFESVDHSGIRLGKELRRSDGPPEKNLNTLISHGLFDIRNWLRMMRNQVNSTVRDSTHVLDGLLYHETDLSIKEHYTDTAGFTDHVFALCHLLGFRFAPRIRDLADKKLDTINSGNTPDYRSLQPLIGGKAQLRSTEHNWDDLLRLAASIRNGTVTASRMLAQPRLDAAGDQHRQEPGLRRGDR